MTRDLTTPPRGNVPAQARPTEIDGQAYRDGLRDIRRLLAPFEAWARLELWLPPGAMQRWKALAQDFWVNDLCRGDRTPSTCAAYAVEAAFRTEYTHETVATAYARVLGRHRRNLGEIPAAEELRRVHDLAQAVLAQPASESFTAQIVAATNWPFQGKAESMPRVEATVDLLHAAALPPPIVAKAKETLLSEPTRRFAPAPGEFLEACNIARSVLTEAVKHTSRALIVRDALEQTVAGIEARPAPAIEPPRRAASYLEHRPPAETDEIPF